MELFKFYDFHFTLINIIDILLIGVISFQLYRLLKGSLAFNMLIGLLTIYICWLIVRMLGMPLMEGLLGEFTKIGFLVILIVFQQEIRKFLLLIGKNSFFGDNKSLIKFLFKNWRIEQSFHTNYANIVDACETLAGARTGAIIIFPKTSEMKFIGTSGELLNALITKRLLLSIFNKQSPLHDGAVIIANNRIKAANCILPVSDNPEIQNKYGLRHLSAIGITEQTDAIALVVSEERGSISIAKGGKFYENMNAQEINDFLTKEFANQPDKRNSA
jgi:uncharacterized protein (TIGR00159 family)